jgi:hypothetical protein
MNAQIGCRDCEEFSDILGPFGPRYRNQMGIDLLHTYQGIGLRIMNTWFQHDSHITFQSFNQNGSKHMIDMIAVSQSKTNDITDCKTTRDGIRSDHSAHCLIGKLHSFKPTYSSLNKGKPNLKAIATGRNCDRSKSPNCTQYNKEINGDTMTTWRELRHQ